MKKIILYISILLILLFSHTAMAATVYTVVSGDSMWKIAVKYEQGLSEIISLNPQIKNPAIIYPGQKINIPEKSAYTGFEEEVARLVNVERANRGLKPLTLNWQLSRVARTKSQDMINKNYFSHTSPTYGSPFDMMKSFGIKYSSAGENIAKGQRTPQAVMTGWMNSPGHKANILNTSYTEIGVGVAKDSSGTYYWTQMFIKPM
jgi:uncharacterized YkwD family protein/spore coat assembly protein SafA